MSKPITIEVLRYSQGAITTAELFRTNSFYLGRIMLERMREAYPSIVMNEWKQVVCTHLIKFNYIYDRQSVQSLHNYSK
jgi:hypothetical protein